MRALRLTSALLVLACSVLGGCREGGAAQATGLRHVEAGETSGSSCSTIRPPLL